MRTILLISAVLALSACHKTPTATTAGAEGHSAPTTTFPHRRAGLWEQTVSADGKPAIMGALKVCVDATSEARASLFGHNMGKTEKSTCGAPEISHGPNGDLNFSSTCPLRDGTVIVTKGTASGDFSSAYHVHLQTDVTGAKLAAMNGLHTNDIEGKWLGPCPPGMTGGDMELANGMKVGHQSLSAATAAAAALHAGH